MSTAIEVREVANLHDLKRFVAFQYSLYKDDRHWVPPLRTEELRSLQKDRNPSFDVCEARYWLARREGRIVGRIAGIINRRYNERWNERAARFGWCDFIDDREVSGQLLGEVERWAKEQGMHFIHGPLGFTDMDGEGLLVEGFDEIGTLGALYNYPYYQAHIERLGYAKDVDWVEYEITMHGVIPERVARAAEIALERNHLKVLRVTKAREVLPYAKKIFAVLNEAYKNLYGFVELTEKQVDLYVQQYFGFINPAFVPVVLNADDDVVAFGIAMPSLSAALQRCHGRLFPVGWLYVLKALKSPSCLDLYLTAVRPDMQNRGVNAVVIHEINKSLSEYGITRVETNRELENNAKVRAQWKFYDSRQHKRRRCYRKDLMTAV